MFIVLIFSLFILFLVFSLFLLKNLQKNVSAATSTFGRIFLLQRQSSEHIQANPLLSMV
jgi:hypothetical protein